jgi:hypothetical protein
MRTCPQIPGEAGDPSPIIMGMLLAVLCLLLALAAPAHAQFINQTVNCATSVDGTVVGILNPLTTTTTSTTSGTLAPATYYIEYTFYAPVGETLASPEQTQQLTMSGGITIAAPSGGIPSGSTGMNVYIGTTSGGETLQGSTASTNSFVQSTALNAGSTVPPGTNTTICQLLANDALWPTGTGYTVVLSDSAGNVYPGYPTMWQFMGPGTTINLSNGLPEYHGVWEYPTPILASPLNHGSQSILGSLSLGPNTLYANKVVVNGLSVGSLAGFTGTKVAGSCTFTITSGIITGVSGC